jgi:hypothetical protein
MQRRLHDEIDLTGEQRGDAVSRMT